MTLGSAPASSGEHDPEQQFRALYDGNFAAVLGYTLRRVEQPADAADVVSEVFLVAWRRLDEAPPGDGRPCLFGWDGLTPSEAAGVVGIAPGTARMRLARARRRFRELLEPGCDAPATPGHVQAVPFEHVIGESR